MWFALRGGWRCVLQISWISLNSSLKRNLAAECTSFLLHPFHAHSQPLSDSSCGLYPSSIWNSTNLGSATSSAQVCKHIFHFLPQDFSVWYVRKEVTCPRANFNRWHTGAEKCFSLEVIWRAFMKVVLGAPQDVWLDGVGMLVINSTAHFFFPSFCTFPGS